MDVRVRILSVLLTVCCTLFVRIASAQSPSTSAPTPVAETGHQHPGPLQDQHTQHHGNHTEAFPTREASGTSWLPDESPMYGIHQTAGSWQLMWHGNGFAQFLYDSGDRGKEQAGSINWVMAMPRRPLGAGRVGLRGMFSLEPLTIPGCGYPDLLATGEACDGEPIHDRQHPHDLFMELAAEYDRPLHGPVRWQVYGGLAGEPALGAAAYPHRISAMPNPLAPISHHWLDATHITFGVLTAGVYTSRWKAEGSVFNGREPDEDRWNTDLAPLDSFSGRLWFAPSSSVVLQVSAGQLTEAEPSHDDAGRADVSRVTASASLRRQSRPGRLWASTIAWGLNSEEGEASKCTARRIDADTRRARYMVRALRDCGQVGARSRCARFRRDLYGCEAAGRLRPLSETVARSATRLRRRTVRRHRPERARVRVWKPCQFRDRRVRDAAARGDVMVRGV